MGHFKGLTLKYLQIEIANVWTRPWKERELEIHVWEERNNDGQQNKFAYLLN